MAEYYAQRASVGLIIAEATVISKQANGWVNSPGIYSDSQAQAWKQVVDAVHAKGTPFFSSFGIWGELLTVVFRKMVNCQFLLLLLSSMPILFTLPLANSPMKLPELWRRTRSLVVEDYRRAAQRAKDAGFDGVEIHAANGYLIDQFLQSKTNHRTDQYGGSLENRYRFLKEIVEAILTVWPVNRVGVRLSPNGNYNDMGSEDFEKPFFMSHRS
jgi:N-ethylmaleimide reductase